MLTPMPLTVAKAARAKSRGGGTFTISVDDPNLERDSEAISAAADNGGSREPSWCEYIHLRQDLHRVVYSLPQHLQDCCHRLTEDSVTEAARHSGLARGSISSRMATVKRAFAAAGLQVYLARPCPTLSASAR